MQGEAKPSSASSQALLHRGSSERKSRTRQECTTLAKSWAAPSPAHMAPPALLSPQRPSQQTPCSVLGVGSKTRPPHIAREGGFPLLPKARLGWRPPHWLSRLPGTTAAVSAPLHRTKGFSHTVPACLGWLRASAQLGCRPWLSCISWGPWGLHPLPRLGRSSISTSHPSKVPHRSSPPGKPRAVPAFAQLHRRPEKGRCAFSSDSYSALPSLFFFFKGTTSA